ncbi:MAG: hypothetical protein VXY77_02770 [Pseudomonadota bacterium]|nr:hypothetical protein [Pseudomonadota bacterium]
MNTYSVIPSIVIALLLAVGLYYRVRQKPEQFTSSSIQKTLFTLGILALVLIAFVGLMVSILRSS